MEDRHDIVFLKKSTLLKRWITKGAVRTEIPSRKTVFIQLELYMLSLLSSKKRSSIEIILFVRIDSFAAIPTRIEAAPSM